MSDKSDKIKLISISHYILGGIMAVFSFFPLIHLFMGIAILVGAFDGQNPENAPPRFLGLFFVIMAAVFILVGITISTLILISGYKLSKLKSRMFCLVMGCVQCLFMPFGTVLGVFTIILLADDEVIQLFKENAQSD